MTSSSKTEVLHGLAKDAGIRNHLSKDETVASTSIDEFRETKGHIVAILGEVNVFNP